MYAIRIFIFIAGFLALTGCSNSDHQLIVTTQNNLESSKVEIKKDLTSINRENDLHLFSSNMQTVYDGKDMKKLHVDFGENDFLVIYNDAYYYSFHHFIRTDFRSDYPTPHTYSFNLFLQHDSLYLSVDIAGDEPMQFTRPMIPKALAQYYRCNTPIDASTTLFNMIEMTEK